MDQQQHSEYDYQQQSSQDQRPKKKKPPQKRTVKKRSTHNKKCSGKLCIKKPIHERTTASLGTGGNPVDRCSKCSLLEKQEYFSKNTERYKELRRERLATGGGGKTGQLTPSQGGGIAIRPPSQRRASQAIIQKDPIAISAKLPCIVCGRMTQNSPDGMCRGCRQDG